MSQPAGEPLPDVIDDDDDETRALGRALSDAAVTVTGAVENVHRAVADRTFPAAAAPLKAVHDAISGRVYSSIGAGVAATGRLVDRGLHLSGLTRKIRPWSGIRAARNVAAVVNGAFGHRLGWHHPLQATPMQVRHAGSDVPLNRRALESRFAEPSSYVVVLLHGLVETDEWWDQPVVDGSAQDFGSWLTGDVGCTAVRVRYNTGRHISDNGRELADLVARLVAEWPVPVDRIALVGHSMGGLVARSAVHQAYDQPWVRLVGDVVCLATPHNGSPVGRGANLLAWALRGFGESAPRGGLVDLRSAGSKDLRYGYLDERDWVGIDPDVVLIDSRRTRYRSAQTARLRLAAPTVSNSSDSRAGRWVGDLLVLPASAMPDELAGERRRFPGMHHFHLRRRRSVYEQVRGWLRHER